MFRPIQRSLREAAESEVVEQIDLDSGRSPQSPHQRRQAKHEFTLDSGLAQSPGSGSEVEISTAQAVLPASMVRTVPVILRLPSPMRYSTMRATSSVSGKRRNALRPAMRLR